MIRFILFLVTAIFVGVFLQRASPDFSFTYNQILIKIPTWHIVASILIIIVLFNWLLKIAIVNWYQHRLLSKSLKYTAKIITTLINGNIFQAEKYLSKINNSNTNNLVQFNWLKSLVELIKSEIYYNQADYDLALMELNKLNIKLPNYKLILLRLTAIYNSLNNWQELFKLLPVLKKYQIYSIEAYQQLESKIYQEYLEQLANTEKELALKFFKEAPKSLKQNPPFILRYINCLLKFEYYDLAESTIKTNLLLSNIDLNNINDIAIVKLIKIYGLIKSSNVKQQIKNAENLIRKYPNNGVLLLTLGRLCIYEKLWGKAKNYLEHAIQIYEDPDCYIELGKVAELLGESEKSLSYYQNAIKQI